MRNLVSGALSMPLRFRISSMPYGSWIPSRIIRKKPGMKQKS